MARNNPLPVLVTKSNTSIFRKRLAIFFVCLLLTGGAASFANAEGDTVYSAENGASSSSEILNSSYNSGGEITLDHSAREEAEEILSIGGSGEGEVSVYDGSFSGEYQQGNLSASNQLDVELLKAEYYYKADAGFYTVSKDGKEIPVAGADIEVGATVTVIGVEYTGEVTWGGDFAEFAAKVDAEAEVVAEATGSLQTTISEEGAIITGEFDTFAGARASAQGEVSLDVGGIEFKVIAAGEASAGIGASGGFQFQVTEDGIVLGAGIAATLGVGLGGNVAVSVDPSDLAEALGLPSVEVLLDYLEKIQNTADTIQELGQKTQEFFSNPAEGITGIADTAAESMDAIKSGFSSFLHPETEVPQPLASTAYQMAKLSEAVYDNRASVCCCSGSGGQDDSADSWILNDGFDDSSSTGFHASLYEQKNAEGEVINRVIVFEGTDPLSGADLGSDVAGAAGMDVQQAQALIFTKKIVDNFGKDNLVITGHSLGGRLAQLSAATFGLDAYTFNSASVSKFAAASAELAAPYLSPEGFDTDGIHNFVENNDPVNPLSKIFGADDLGSKIYINYDGSLIDHGIATHVNYFAGLSGVNDAECCKEEDEEISETASGMTSETNSGTLLLNPTKPSDPLTPGTPLSPPAALTPPGAPPPVVKSPPPVITPPEAKTPPEAQTPPEAKEAPTAVTPW